jgi:hypothetical protein
MSEHFLEEHIKRIRDLSDQITRVRPLHEVHDSQRYDSDDEEPVQRDEPDVRPARVSRRRRR